MTSPKRFSRSLQLLLASLLLGALVIACGPSEPAQPTTTTPTPTTTDPAVTDPAVTDPAVTDPAADPAVTDPAVPATAEPVTEPDAEPIDPDAPPTEEELEIEEVDAAEAEEAQEETETVDTETVETGETETVETEEAETEETEETEAVETEEVGTEEEVEPEDEETEGAAAPAEAGEVSITLDNVGDEAWVVSGAEGATVAEEGQENPTLTLTVGTRYTIVNQGGAEHPLDFRADDNTFLLAQGNIEGSFEGDEEVGWQDSENEVSFTLTQELADQLATYYCTVHPNMQGNIEIANQ